MLKEKGYDYLCVTKAKLKDYTEVNAATQPIEISDKRWYKISLTLVSKADCEDQFLHIKSEQKPVKKVDMGNRVCVGFEEELKSLERSIQSKGGKKKI